MKHKFRNKLGLNINNKKMLEKICKIIDEYKEAGYLLTLRQLYYQLVSRDIIPNKVSEYSKLSTLLVKGRMAGIIDWDSIEDRIRKPYIPYYVKNVADALDDTVSQYRLNRQSNQDVYIELWVEKDALSGVLRRITSEYHINLMVNRGYSSCTAMYDAYKRILVQESNGKKCYILYLGDHDPSGLDMIRDIRERLSEFGVDPEVRQIGLTREQIDKYNPPPNPAKLTDPRAKWYIEINGNTSWEVDALTPEVLHKLVRKHIEGLIDKEKFNNKLKKEERDKKILEKMKDRYDEGYFDDEDENEDEECEQ